MVGDPVQGARGGDRAGKRAGRRARGLAVIERDGVWHVHGTLRAGGRSIRLRRSLGLPASAATYDAAWDEVRSIEQDLRAEATGQSVRGDPVAVAAHALLTLKRKRPIGPSVVRIIKEIVVRFGQRRLNDIPDREWTQWVDKRHAGNSAATRERFLSGVVAFLNFSRKHHRLARLPVFARDGAARNPNRRARRRVQDLRPELIGLLFDQCHISLRAQLAVEWSTGARVSSILYGARLCDLILAEGREQIVFHDTKNGDSVNAALHPAAAQVLRDYLKWRGNLHDREGALFLTWLKQPYVDNGRAWGGQNKTGFHAARRRARRVILDEAFAEARILRERDRQAALELLLHAREDARLLRKVTQHWFRHMLATRMRGDLRAAMEQGGWKDQRSLLGYTHDVPAERRAIVAGFEGFGTPLTREKAASRKA